MIRGRGAIAFVLAALMLGGTSISARKSATLATFRAIQNWVAAVKSHTPGQNDEWVEKVSAYSIDTRRELDAGLPLFLMVLTQTGGTGEASSRARGWTEADKDIAGLARLTRGDLDPRTFLKRAILLHSDAAMFKGRYDLSADANEPAERQSRIRVDPRSGLPVDVDDQSRIHPLLSRRRVYMDEDGQVLGNSFASWQWPFARWLLNPLAISTPDPFVGAWYHATTAFMLAKGLNAEVTTHLQRAGEILPDDPRILFDRACYSENLGLPRHQVLLPDENDAERALHHDSRLGWRAADAATMGIPKLTVTNAEAERLFSRALKVDPRYVEARVRLARLLIVRKKFDEAATELATALDQKPDDPVITFYANLFAGRAAQALGRGADAAQHYRAALEIFPDAQSALLGLSHAGLLAADVPATLEPVQHLGDQTAVRTADPWWWYYMGAGRAFEKLLDGAWDTVQRDLR